MPLDTETNGRQVGLEASAVLVCPAGVPCGAGREVLRPAAGVASHQQFLATWAVASLEDQLCSVVLGIIPGS